MQPRSGPRRSDLVVAGACVLAVALFGAPRARPVVPAPVPVSAPGPAAPAGQRASAGVAVLDADRVQRRVVAPAVALTFDDGPDPRWTPAVLELLRRYRVHATFCLVGRHVAEHPELVRRIVADGHLLCDHTWDHDEKLGTRSPAAISADLRRTYDAIVRAAGTPPVYFRAPAGNWTPGIVAQADRLGLRPLGWSVDTRDWTRPAPAVIAGAVLRGARGGAVVLLHDGYGDRSRTLAALRTILPALAGRVLVTP